jgi:hypothetical protein
MLRKHMVQEAPCTLWMEGLVKAFYNKRQCRPYLKKSCNDSRQHHKEMAMPILAMALFIMIFSFVEVIEAACTGSSPTWTSTPDFASVNSCVSSASRGDMINVTAGVGTVTWTSTLNLTKGVSLIGPGRDSLVVTNPSSYTISIQPDATAIANEETIRLSGFTFDAAGTSAGILQIVGAGPTSVKAFKRLIVETNRLKNSTAATAIYQTGQVRGVVANNIFDRTITILRCFGNDSKAEWTNGNFPFAYGSGDNLYYEDNTIQWSSVGTESCCSGWVECGQGGRIVMRYNTWNYANAAHIEEVWDVHGFQNWPNGQTGTMLVEYYGNTITGFSGYRWLFHRGGQGVFHNNMLLTTGGNPSFHLGQYDGGCNQVVDSTWPLPNGQLNTVYGYNNSINGSAVPLTVISPTPGFLESVCPSLENVAFWNANASCTSLACVAGIGRGNTAPTGTCVTGVGYWVASTPTPTVDPNVIQNGAFYKCTSTNTWTLYYKPYIYPHPLRNGSGSGTDTTPPQAPGGLRIS